MELCRRGNSSSHTWSYLLIAVTGQAWSGWTSSPILCSAVLIYAVLLYNLICSHAPPCLALPCSKWFHILLCSTSPNLSLFLFFKGSRRTHTEVRTSNSEDQVRQHTNPRWLPLRTVQVNDFFSLLLCHVLQLYCTWNSRILCSIIPWLIDWRGDARGLNQRTRCYLFSCPWVY